MQKLFYRLLFYKIKVCPSFFFEALFIIFYPLYKNSHKHKAWGRVKRLLEETKLDSKTTPKAVFYSLYKNALDSFRFLGNHKKTAQKITYENEYLIQNTVADKTPIVAISIHQGPFEILHRSLCRYHKRVHLLTSPFQNAHLTNALHRIRQHPHLIDHSTKEVGYALKKVIREKGILAMLIDQAKNGKGNKVRLRNKDFLLYLKVPLKANQMGAAIITFRTFATKERIIVRFEKLYPPKSSEELIKKSVAREVENWIEEHPEQWTWNYHKNFKVNENDL